MHQSAETLGASPNPPWDERGIHFLCPVKASEFSAPQGQSEWWPPPPPYVPNTWYTLLNFYSIIMLLL